MGGLVSAEWLKLFAGKRVLLTGDTGFKGSWLALWLSELGADVVGYALPPERPDDHFNLIQLEKRIHHIDGDIRDLEKLADVAAGFQPVFLFHLAAQSLVRLSYDRPKYTFDTNVGGSVNLLEIARLSTSLRCLIYVTSDKCYKNNEWVWGYRETDTLGGRDPYSASKAAAEFVFEAYGRSFFDDKPDFGAASVRSGNVIGGGDWAEDRIVPDCVKSLRANQPVTLRNPDSTRPWQHVLEPLSGYLRLAVALNRSPSAFSGAWNFGPAGDSIRTVLDLAGQFVKLWGSGKINAAAEVNTLHEAKLLHLNCDKARRLLGWKPLWDFDRTVQETVSWYKGFIAGTSPSQLSTQQLRHYMESME